MIERQELHCHACGRYVQFDVDLSMNGNHVLECPNCGHEHCRVVEDGVITGIRWGHRNGPTIHVSRGSTASTTVSIYTSASTSRTSGAFMYQAWANTTSNS